MILRPDIPLVLDLSPLNGFDVTDADEFALHRNFFDKIQKAYSFESTWCIYEVTDLTVIPFPDALRVHYQISNYFGRSASRPLAIDGLTWLHLWAAADRCMFNSGDKHHVFLEGLQYKPVERTVYVHTGS
jgi:hypothetical protein